MRYVHIENPGSHSRLRVLEKPAPQPQKDQLLIRVHAAALNRADLMQRYGKYPPPPGECDIPGLEISGEVVEVGDDVKQFSLGDKVYALVGSGAFADYCLAYESLTAKIPSEWDYLHASALPEALITVHATVFSLGNLQSGQNLLVHGAGSGIGSLAIQMANQSGGHVITTAGNHQKIMQALELGARQAINHHTHDFEDLIPEASLDVILDFVGGDYFNKHLHLLKPQGKLIQIACIKGSLVECNITLLMRKRLHILGFVLRSQSIEEKSLLWKQAH